MNGVDPYAWAKPTLEPIANRWPNSDIESLMPWNFKPLNGLCYALTLKVLPLRKDYEISDRNIWRACEHEHERLRDVFAT